MGVSKTRGRKIDSNISCSLLQGLPKLPMMFGHPPTADSKSWTMCFTSYRLQGWRRVRVIFQISGDSMDSQMLVFKEPRSKEALAQPGQES